MTIVTSAARRLIHRIGRSFVMSIIGLKLGGKLGTAAGEHGEVVGAIVLIGISGAMAMGWLLPGRLGGGRVR